MTDISPSPVKMTRLCEFIRQAGVAKSTVWLWARQGKLRTYKVSRAVFVDEDFPTFCQRMERERQAARDPQSPDQPSDE